MHTLSQTDNCNLSVKLNQSDDRKTEYDEMATFYNQFNRVVKHLKIRIFQVLIVSVIIQTFHGFTSIWKFLWKVYVNFMITLLFFRPQKRQSESYLKCQHFHSCHDDPKDELNCLIFWIHMNRQRSKNMFFRPKKNTNIHSNRVFGLIWILIDERNFSNEIPIKKNVGKRSDGEAKWLVYLCRWHKSMVQSAI